jgi:hypothetical protein
MNVTPFTLKRAPALEEAGEYQKSMSGRVTAPRKLTQTSIAASLEYPLGGHKPGMQGAQIFQTSHRQIAELGGRGLLVAAGPYFLHKIRLNLPALEPSQGTLSQARA